MRKIIDGIAIASGVGVIAILGGGAYGYYWFSQNQDKLQEIVIEKVKEQLPIPKIGGAKSLPSLVKGKGLPF